MQGREIELKSENHCCPVNFLKLLRVLADLVHIPPLGELVPNPFGRAQGEEELHIHFYYYFTSE